MNLPQKSGFYVPHYYDQFLETGNPEFKEAIIVYNNKDVIQTHEIANWYDKSQINVLVSGLWRIGGKRFRKIVSRKVK